MEDASGQPQSSNIAILLDLLQVEGCSDHSIIIANKAILLEVVATLGESGCEQLVLRLRVRPVQIGSDRFKAWAVAARKAADLSQLKVGEDTGIGAGQICKFEKGKIDFAKGRRQTLKDYLEGHLKAKGLLSA